MNALSRQRCFHHNDREAAALCPECRRYYCRECVTEHDGRVLCAMCLSHLCTDTKVPSRRFGAFVRLFQFLSAGLILWLFFFYLGQILLTLPSEFHDGTLWQKLW